MDERKSPLEILALSFASMPDQVFALVVELVDAEIVRRHDRMMLDPEHRAYHEELDRQQQRARNN